MYTQTHLPSPKFRLIKIHMTSQFYGQVWCWRGGGLNMRKDLNDGYIYAHMTDQHVMKAVQCLFLAITIE